MDRLDKFAYAGMVSYNKPSSNSVGFFSPAALRTGVEAGSLSIQSDIVIEPGAYLCSNNHPIVIGDVNPNTGHLHPGKVTVENNAWFGHIGDGRNNLLLLADKADGTLIVDGGRVILEKGNIRGNKDFVSTICVNEGVLSTQSIELGPRTSFRLRHGMIKAKSIKGPFRVWVYGGILSIEKEILTGTINLTGTGALLYGSGEKPLDASHMGKAGVNFVGDGGCLIVKIFNPEGSLSKLFTTESLYEALRKEGKIKRDGEPIQNFKDFRMEQIIGKNDHSYAVLRPTHPGEGRFGIISDKLRKLFYGENPSDKISL